MFAGIPAARWLNIVNDVRIVAGGIAAIAAILAGIAQYGQIKLQAIVGREKDARAAEAKRESDERIAQAHAEAAAANERAAALEKQAAEAQLELARLEERTAPRRLTSRAAAIITDKVRGSPFQVVLRYISGDAESHRYADQLADALVASGNVQVTLQATAFAAGVPTGVMISRTPRSENVRLLKAIEVAGIPFTRSNNTEELAIVVGAKP